MEILPSAEELGPGTAGHVKINVRDGEKPGKKARIFVWAVNEGTLQMHRYQVPDLFTEFNFRNLWQLAPRGKQLLSSSQQVTHLHYQAGYFGRKYKDYSLRLNFCGTGQRIYGYVRDSSKQPLAGVKVTVETHLLKWRYVDKD